MMILVKVHELSRIDYGDLPTWINIALTAIAVGASIYAAFNAAKILERELERDNQRINALEKSQAELVSSWARPFLDEISGNDIYCIPGIASSVINYSNQPVYDVSLKWWIDGQVEFESYVDLLPPNQEVVRHLSNEILDQYVGENGYATSIVRIFEANETLNTLCEFIRIEISFADASNRRWQRDKSGYLTKAT